MQHPWTVDVLGQHVQIGPNTLRLLDEWMAALTPLALPARRAWRIVTAVNDYVTGYVVREGAQRRVVPVDDDQAARWQRELGAYLTTMADTGELPHIAELLRNGFARNDDNFTHGLNWLIDSIAAAHPTPELNHTD